MTYLALAAFQFGACFTDIHTFAGLFCTQHFETILAGKVDGGTPSATNLLC
jgi:hypothetical protein